MLSFWPLQNYTGFINFEESTEQSISKCSALRIQGFPVLGKSGVARGGQPLAGARGGLASLIQPPAAGGRLDENWKALSADRRNIDKKS